MDKSTTELLDTIEELAQTSLNRWLSDKDELSVERVLLIASTVAQIGSARALLAIAERVNEAGLLSRMVEIGRILSRYDEEAPTKK